MGALLLLAVLLSQTGFPVYTLDSIANAASNKSGSYAPNSFVSIYGKDLSYVTRALASSDLSAGQLPTVLSGTAVRVLIGLSSTNVFFVSPGQVNVLIPAGLKAGDISIQLSNSALVGPPVKITLTDTAPAIFQIDSATLAATHADGSLITSKSPAKPGEVIVLYAGGLGPTSPEQIAGQLAKTAATVATPGFGVWLNGLPVSATAIKYAGITPGFAGLYQVNLELPSNVASPEVRIGFGSPTSPGGLYLPTN